MAKRAEWAKRVAVWRASGLKARDFCSGRDFSPKNLVWWSWHLSRTEDSVPAKHELARTKRPAVTLARVVRRPVQVQTEEAAIVVQKPVRVRGHEPMIVHKLNDGLYQLRVAAVGTDGVSDGSSEQEVYFQVKGGKASEISSNEWFQKSNANQGSAE